MVLILMAYWHKSMSVAVLRGIYLGDRLKMLVTYLDYLVINIHFFRFTAINRGPVGHKTKNGLFGLDHDQQKLIKTAHLGG